MSHPRSLHRWWLDLSVRAKGSMVLAVPLLALVVVTVSSLMLQVSERHERSAARAAFAVGSAANQILLDGVNAETGVRGYAVTGHPVFLAPYELVLARIGPDRAALRAGAVAEGDSGRARAVDATTARVLAELAGLRSAVSGGASARDLAPALAREKAAADLLRRQVSSLASGPAAQLAGQRSEIGRLETAIDAVNIVGLALGLIAGLIGVALFTSGISRRVGVNAQNASRLGEGLPLVPSAPSHDEIGRVAESLVRAHRLLASRTAELTAARDDALKATQAKNSFLSHTSHELRTPLNSILGFTQLLELSELGDEDRDSVQRILAAGRHLLALINDLIDIARIESGDLSLSVEPIAVRPLIEEASQLIGPLAADRSITVTVHCANPGLAARADRHRFLQVVVNLMSNAVKYNRRGGTITITCENGGAGLTDVVISDTGPGIAPEDIQRIFAPFQRLGAEATSIEGTGIGLPLARTLTEAMGGRLTVASVVGQGSAFTVSLASAPDLAPDASCARAHRSAGGPQPSSGAILKVLYIEDNPANVEVVSRFLGGRPDTSLECATTGRAGLRYAARRLPDIILLDLHLQDMHGEDVLRELKDEPRTAAVPVAVLSAEAASRVIHRVQRNGAFAYLTKPLDLAELGELLDSIAPREQSRRDRAGPAGGRQAPAVPAQDSAGQVAGGSPSHRASRPGGGP